MFHLMLSWSSKTALDSHFWGQHYNIITAIYVFSNDDSSYILLRDEHSWNLPCVKFDHEAAATNHVGFRCLKQCQHVCLVLSPHQYELGALWHTL